MIEDINFFAIFKQFIISVIFVIFLLWNVQFEEHKIIDPYVG